MKHRRIQRKLGIAVTAALLSAVTVSGIQPAWAQEGTEAAGVETAVETPVQEPETEAPAEQEIPAIPAEPEAEVPEEPETEQEVPSEPETPAVPDVNTPSDEETSEEETPEEEQPSEDTEEEQPAGQPDTSQPEEEEPSEPSEEPDADETEPSEGAEEPSAEPSEPSEDETESSEEPEEEPSEEPSQTPAPAPETPAPALEPAAPVLPQFPSLGTKTESAPRLDKPSFLPSEPFLPKELRVKYSADQPLEGIPSFITSEMITGALKVQDEYGYPASVTIAQIIQESGFGKYGPGGEEGKGLSYLAYQYNNLFGIKGTGTAGSVSMKTGEQRADGTSYTIRAGFRAYHTYTESMEDRAELLEEVYADLISGVTDANTFAMRIAGRWATDVDYGYSLLTQMERYDLYRLDRMTLEDYDSLLGDFADPCPGASVTSRYGWREWSDSFHRGIDLGTGVEEIPTYAAASGTVTYAGWGGTAGNLIVIDHGEGVVTKYMHHSQMYVEEGEKVEKGQQIGLSGSTGNSTGNHLHFQLEIGGEAVDPEPWLIEAR